MIDLRIILVSLYVFPLHQRLDSFLNKRTVWLKGSLHFEKVFN